MGKKARDSRVQVGNSLAQALEGATLVFSTVTAGEALKVAQQAAALLQPGQYFLDLNSVAPETKRQAAEHFLPGAYIDVAVMAPVPPARLQTPLLIGGPQAEAIAPRLQGLGLPVGLNTVFGPSGLVALPLMTSGSGIYAGMAVYVGGLAVSYLCGFVLTWLFGSKNVDLS